jgi:hypothetical protein
MLLQLKALARKLIEIRSGRVASVKPNVGPSQIVSHDEHDIGTWALLRSGNANREAQQAQEIQ